MPLSLPGGMQLSQADLQNLTQQIQQAQQAQLLQQLAQAAQQAIQQQAAAGAATTSKWVTQTYGCLLPYIQILIMCWLFNTKWILFDIRSTPTIRQTATNDSITWLLCPPRPSRPWGEGGHLDLLWFPVTQMCVSVRPSASMPDFVYAIFPTVFHQWLSNSQIWWPWTRPWID